MARGCSFLFLFKNIFLVWSSSSCGVGVVLAFPARHFVDAVDSFKRGASRSIGGVQLQVHPLFLDNHCRSELFGSGAGAFWAHEVVQTPGHARRLAVILRLRFAWVALGALLATEVVPGGDDPESTEALSRGSGSGDEGRSSSRRSIVEEQEISKTSLVEEANRARKKVSDNHRRALYGERGRTPWDSVLDEPAIRNLLKLARTKDVAINSSDIPRIIGGPADQYTRINLPRIGMGFGAVCNRGDLADRHRGSYDICESSFRERFREQGTTTGHSAKVRVTGANTTIENLHKSIVSDAIWHDNLRLFDSAWLYGSDPFLGRAIKTALHTAYVDEAKTGAPSVRREGLFVITKLVPDNSLASAINVNSHDRDAEVH